MVYRICKSFEVESGHMLMKHPDRCRFPHGHTRRIDVVLSSRALDSNDMVCDFSAIKHALREHIDRLDHAMAVNSLDPRIRQELPNVQSVAVGGADPLLGRTVVFEGQDPTTEVMARSIFDYLVELIRSGTEIRGEGRMYRFPPGVTVERVRVTETSTSWAEYGLNAASS